MITPIYNLPSIVFVGGESETFVFNLYTKSGTPYDAHDCEVGFAIIDYLNKEGAHVITKESPNVKIRMGSRGVENIVIVDLLPPDTLYLEGRYVYQVTVQDSAGEVEIPGQGIIDIVHNIHQDFLA